MSTKISKSNHPKLYVLRRNMAYFDSDSKRTFPSDNQVVAEAAELIACQELKEMHAGLPYRSQMEVSRLRRALRNHYRGLNLSDLSTMLSITYDGKPMRPVV